MCSSLTHSLTHSHTHTHVYLNEATGGRYVPRAVLMDLEPGLPSDSWMSQGLAVGLWIQVRGVQEVNF